MIFVDSSVWIDYFNGKRTWQTDRLDQELGVESLVLGDIVLAEVLQGFRDDDDFEKAKDTLSLFPCVNIGGVDIAIKSAYNFRLLRKKGLTIRKTIDMLIATLCIERGYQLLQDDKDFLPLVKYLGLDVLTSQQ